MKTILLNITGIIVLIIFGTFAIRPHWFGIVTPDTVSTEEYQNHIKSDMTPNYSPISAISNAPTSQSQYDEENALVFSREFIESAGNSYVTFENDTLNQQECDYLASKGNEQISYEEFISSSNLFLTGEYFYDSWSITPLQWYINTLSQFCPSWKNTEIYNLYQDYDTEITQPAMQIWYGDNPPDEPIADIRNSHSPRPSIEWIATPTH